MTDTIVRPYSRDDVRRLRGSVRVEHTLARLGAERLRTLLEEREWVAALGAMTGERVLDANRAAQAPDVVAGVGAHDGVGHVCRPFGSSSIDDWILNARFVLRNTNIFTFRIQDD